MFTNYSFTKKLILILGVISLLTSMLVGLSSYYLIKSSILTNIKKELKQYTSFTNNYVATSINVTVRSYLKSVAESNRRELEYYYNEWQNGNMALEQAREEIVKITLEKKIGEKGYVYYLDTLGRVRLHPEFSWINKDLSELDWVKEKIGTREAFIELNWNDSITKNANEKLAYMTYFEPWDYIVVAMINKEDYYQLIDIKNVKEQISSIQLRETGYIYVMDTKGKLVIHPNMEGENIFSKQDEDGHFFIQEMCDKKNGSITYPWREPNETEMRDKIAYYEYLPDMDWIIVSGVYTDKLYEPIEKLRIGLTFLIVIIMIIVTYLSIKIGKSIARPLIMLARKVEAFGEGDKLARSEVTGTDEVALVSITFNEMADNLIEYQSRIEEYNQNLEKKVEERTLQLKESERVLFNIIEFLPDAVLVIDAAGKVIAWNKGMENITGVKAEDIIGKGNFEYSIPFHGERCPLLIDYALNPDKYSEKKFEGFQQNGNVYVSESYIQKLKSIYIIGTATALTNSKGERTGAIETFKDTTFKKKAEEALKRANQQLLLQNDEISQQKEEILATSEMLAHTNRELEKLSIVARETDNAVIILDPAGNFEWVNEGFNRLYGYTLGEFKREFSTNLKENSSNPEIAHLFDECVRSHKSVNYESFFRAKDSRIVWTQTTLTPIIDDSGNVVKLIAIDSDITAIKEAQAEINQQKDEIEAQRDEIERQRDFVTEQRDKIALQNKKITDSILYARRIQTALLQSSLGLHKILPQHFIYFRPKDIVSGDFFWMKRVGDRVMFAGADCTGHGVPGAFMSLLGIAFLNDIINKTAVISPYEALNEMRKRVKSALRQMSSKGEGTKDGIDIALCSLDYKTNKLEFSGAYSPLYIIRHSDLPEVSSKIKSGNQQAVEGKWVKNSSEILNNAVLYQIKADRMPIGVYRKEKDSFTNHEIQLYEGDMLYLFSDGYADQFGSDKNRKFSINRFKNLLLKIYDKPLLRQKYIVEDIFVRWKGNHSQIDDILVMGIRV